MHYIIYTDQIYIHCTICYYFTACEFFISALTGGILLESEWHQVSSTLQDSSQYSNQS